MKNNDPCWSRSLALTEDPEELKARYRIYTSETLERWARCVKGPHRDAMLAVLAERRPPQP